MNRLVVVLVFSMPLVMGARCGSPFPWARTHVLVISGQSLCPTKGLTHWSHADGWFAGLGTSWRVRLEDPLQHERDKVNGRGGPWPLVGEAIAGATGEVPFVISGCVGASLIDDHTDSEGYLEDLEELVHGLVPDFVPVRAFLWIHGESAAGSNPDLDYEDKLRDLADWAESTFDAPMIVTVLSDHTPPRPNVAWIQEAQRAVIDHPNVCATPEMTPVGPNTQPPCPDMTHWCLDSQIQTAASIYLQGLADCGVLP